MMPNLKLTEAQQNIFRNQILIVLADYQRTMPSTCPKCFRPFVSFDSPAVNKFIVRARLDDLPVPEAALLYCPECGADAYGFARGESTRVEVADRIMANLKASAKQ